MEALLNCQVYVYSISSLWGLYELHSCDILCLSATDPVRGDHRIPCGLNGNL